MSAGPSKDQVRRALSAAAKRFAEELKAAVGNPRALAFVTGRGDARTITVTCYEAEMTAGVKLLRASNGEAAVVRAFGRATGGLATTLALAAARNLGN